MFIVTTRFTRKKAALLIILLGIVLGLAIILVSRIATGDEPTLPRLEDNNQRIAYLQTLGWEVASEPLETLQVLLPPQLGEPYLTYNQLQLAQGFDLSAGCGRQVSRYTYAVTNYPGRSEGVQANLYICEGLPVAGDVFCAGADGFQEPLIQNRQEE